MNFYKKTIFIFSLIVLLFLIFLRLVDPIIEKNINNIFKDKKLSEKIIRELDKSVEDFTPEKREFYKKIIKQTYKKWKPLIEESLNEAKKELKN